MVEGRSIMAAAVVGATAILQTACGRTVAIVPPTPDPTAGTACTIVAAGLPSTVAGTPRRPASPDSPLTAAWGDPPITLRCGVERPAALQPTSPVIEIDGVSWFAEEASGGRIFTSVNTKAYVEVAIPSAYDPPATALVDISGAVSAIRSPAA